MSAFSCLYAEDAARLGSCCPLLSGHMQGVREFRGMQCLVPLLWCRRLGNKL